MVQAGSGFNVDTGAAEVLAEVIAEVATEITTEVAARLGYCL